MTVIPDKAEEIRQTADEAWPRPGDVPCSCGGRAFQCGPGSTTYRCLRCNQHQVVWTGFDDPAWF